MEIRIGVSSCLLGRKVRYDGGHKHDRWITGTLERFLTLVPVCPEVECGLPSPREAMELEGDPLHSRLVTISSKIDLTEKMASFCSRKVEELAEEDLCGFILKAKSPSCGIRGVRVKGDDAARNGSGIFAAALKQRFPLLPMEEEGRLEDPALRENFIERVFAFRRWKDFLQGQRSRGELAAFHAAHKYLIMAHSPKHCRELGKLAAQEKEMPREEVLERYGKPLMEALSRPATAARNVNVLMHLIVCFKKELSAGEREELLELIGRYREGLVPLVVPVTLLNHYVRRYAGPALRGSSTSTPIRGK